MGYFYQGRGTRYIQFDASRRGKKIATRRSCLAIITRATMEVHHFFSEVPHFFRRLRHVLLNFAIILKRCTAGSEGGGGG